MAPALIRAEVERALVCKLKMTQSADDHRRYVLIVDGAIVAKTFVSTGSGYKTIGSELVSKMANQLGVPTGFFAEIVSCTKSREDYLAELGVWPNENPRT